MRILMLHNRYQIRGGEDESTEFEAALLRQHGHEVDLLIFDNKDIGRRNMLRVGFGAVWSCGAYERVENQLRQKEYDLVHIQNFFPLISPAVHYAVKSRKKPVVQALRNYRLLCLNGLLFRDGHTCEDCLRQILPWPGVVHGCYRRSILGSSVVAMMLTVHRALRTWHRQVDFFYTASEFARAKFIECGIPGKKIFVKPNVIYPDPELSLQQREYVLVASRLVEEKGIPNILRAWAQISETIPLKIVGEGPLHSAINKASRQMPWIENLGRKSATEVYALMGYARFVIFPSELYETFGRVITEAYATGTPVLASNIGSVKELVKEFHTGLLFTPGDSGDLAKKVQWAWSHPKEMQEMGRHAREDYEEKYSVDANYRKLLDIYQLAIENNRRNSANNP